MNASAPALSREEEIRSEIGKIRTFGRYARVVCSAIFGFGLVGSALAFLIGLLGVLGVIAIGMDDVPGMGGGFTLQQKMWALPMGAAVIGVWLALVHQLYRLFGNLAAAAIYTSENVRRVRRVGLLWMLSAALSLAIPFAWASLVSLGFIEPSDPPRLDAWLSWAESLNGLVSGGLILLVSWVMDVGLYEKDHAEALRRDADLVI